MKNKTKHETSRINCRGCERIIQLKESNSNKETNPVKMVKRCFISRVTQGNKIKTRVTYLVHLLLLESFPDSSVCKKKKKKKFLQCRRPWFDSWVRKICWRRDRLPTQVFLGFTCGSVDKESVCKCGKPGFSPRFGKIPWRRKRLPTPSILTWRIPQTV